MIGIPGCARDTSQTARSATGLIGGPDTPPPPAPRRGVRVDASIVRPITVLTNVSPVGTRVERRARDLDKIGDVRRQLREHRRRVSERVDDRVRRFARRLGRVREHVGARFDVRDTRDSPRSPRRGGATAFKARAALS